jgi:hypothetical protein
MTSEKRSEPRVEVNRATIHLEGRAYPLKNWSAHGFLAASYAGELKAGDEVEVGIAVPFVGTMREFEGKARVIRVDEERGEIAGYLETMGEDWSDEALAQYFRVNWDD